MVWVGNEQMVEEWSEKRRESIDEGGTGRLVIYIDCLAREEGLALRASGPSVPIGGDSCMHGNTRPTMRYFLSPCQVPCEGVSRM